MQALAGCVLPLPGGRTAAPQARQVGARQSGVEPVFDGPHPDRFAVCPSPWQGRDEASASASSAQKCTFSIDGRWKRVEQWAAASAPDALPSSLAIAAARASALSNTSSLTQS